MSLRVQGVTKDFSPSLQALKDVSLDVAAGELVAIVGPSGSGKSTLLRCIAGLESPDAGAIEVAGRDVSGAAPGERDVAMIFQDLALYPHLTVRQNIAFPLLARKTPKAEANKRVEDVGASLSLSAFLDRRPSELSGGERRRVAIGRAVIREPKLFLMDEPLSNLDAQLKLKVQEELAELQRRLAVATVYVTHDQAEAMLLGEKIVVMKDGRIEQVGAPLEIYDTPRTEWVARFFGRFPMNILPGEVLGAPGSPHVGVRPEDFTIVNDETGIAAQVEKSESLGADTLVLARTGDHPLRVLVSRSFGVAPGDEIRLSVGRDRLHHFDADGSRT